MTTLHDASKVLLGSTMSNHRNVSSRKGALEAGLAVRLKSDNTVSVTKADGELIGISLGKDLSGTDKMAYARKGLGVPILLEGSYEPSIGDVVGIDDATGKAKASGTGVTDVNATFASEKLTGIKEDGSEVSVALIDFAGGL